MKKLLSLLILASALIFISCSSSDDDDSNGPNTTTDALVGTWVCEGSNVPLGLTVPPFKVKKIVATFNSNKSYTVVQTDSSNVSLTLTGTYINAETSSTDNSETTGTKGAKIYTIVANQSSPTAVTATGIYAISATKMTYEVIQTNPALTGVLPPNAAEGFGSTSIAGVKYPIYIQKYVKQ